MPQYSPLPLLNHDLSLPVEDGFHLENTAGQIRYITPADPRSMDALNRLQGDIAHRFHLVEAGINALISLLNDQPQLISFDNTPYVLRDGSHALSAPLGSPAPTDAAHLTRKDFVEGLVTGLQNTVTGILDTQAASILSIQNSLPRYRWSNWTTYVWAAGTKVYVDLPLVVPVTNPGNVLIINLLERLNVGTVEVPEYKYRTMMHGTLGGTAGTGTPGAPAGDGMHVDDFWLQSEALVRVLLPNTSSYATGYSAGADYDLVTPVARALRAVVVEHQ